MNHITNRNNSISSAKTSTKLLNYILRLKEGDPFPVENLFSLIKMLHRDMYPESSVYPVLQRKNSRFTIYADGDLGKIKIKLWSLHHYEYGIGCLIKYKYKEYKFLMDIDRNVRTKSVKYHSNNIYESHDLVKVKDTIPDIKGAYIFGGPHLPISLSFYYSNTSFKYASQEYFGSKENLSVENARYWHRNDICPNKNNGWMIKGNIQIIGEKKSLYWIPEKQSTLSQETRDRFKSEFGETCEEFILERMDWFISFSEKRIKKKLDDLGILYDCVI